MVPLLYYVLLQYINSKHPIYIYIKIKWQMVCYVAIYVYH